MDNADSNQADVDKSEKRIGPRELHAHKQDLWIAIHGRVYALAEFQDHPGGTDVLWHDAGRDASRTFDEIGHSRAAKRMMPKYDIGAFISQEEEAAQANKPVGIISSDASIQVAKSTNKLEPNGSAEIGNRSAVNSSVETLHSVIKNDSLNDQKKAIMEDNDTTSFAKVQKGVRPPTPSFKQDALVGEIHRRPKQPLAPGYGAMDWLRRHQAMTQAPPRRLKMAEVAQHNRCDDAWIVLHGLVYNVTAYFHYHPGGVEELLRGAGRDASSLFESIHPWVNVNALLMKCCVGAIEPDSV